MSNDAREGLPVKHNKVVAVDGICDKAPNLVGLMTRPFSGWHYDEQSKELSCLRYLQLLRDYLQRVGSMLIVGDKENGKARMTNP